MKGYLVGLFILMASHSVCQPASNEFKTIERLKLLEAKVLKDILADMLPNDGVISWSEFTIKAGSRVLIIKNTGMELNAETRASLKKAKANSVVTVKVYVKGSRYYTTTFNLKVGE